MRILITNDDGIHATGLTVLEAIAREISDDVWIVAPEVEHSGASRAMTLIEPVRVRDAGGNRWAISGTPTDCILIALQNVMADNPPDLILSGVNNGQNMAGDTSMSGTIAAALMGTAHGIPSIALSQAKSFRERGSLDWETPQKHGPAIIRRLLADGIPTPVTPNINFPDCRPDDVKGIQMTRQGRRDQVIIETHTRTDLRGNDYVWIAYNGRLSSPPEGTDLHAIYNNYISITPLHTDLTHEACLRMMETNWG